MTQRGLDALKVYSVAQGWAWASGKDIPFGEQLVITAHGQRATVTFYPKRGAMIVGGPASTLRAALEAWIAGDEAASMSVPSAEGDAPPIPFPHIGMDESGKGDWFGPLVVAAVFLDARTAATLRAAGVRDSKTIPAPTLSRLAATIEHHVAPSERHVWAIPPDTYNALYAKHKNINILLADAYAQVSVPVAQNTSAHIIVCDQFSSRADRLEDAFAALGLPRPLQQPRAESASTAVAAASVLATAAFRASLDELGHAVGLTRALPKGASDIVALEVTARQIIQQHGRDALGHYAKLHFKPLQALLSACDVS